ncbi:MAG: EAL domain-containing protein [Xenococcaceae cyanobacterium MO_207.B15]|nr:EAL domain-containing protein [Xenococcaceae cyanobacterium MO_207.B15]
MTNCEPKDGSYLKNELYEIIQKDSSIFEFLQNSALDGIWYWDLESPKNEWMSPRFWQILGYDPADKKHLASEWQNLIHPDDLKKAIKNFELHCRNPEHPYDQIVRYRHKNGSTVWVRCRGIAIRNLSGKPVRMLGAHNDISEVKKAQEKLQTFVEELQQNNKELEQLIYATSCDLEEPKQILSLHFKLMSKLQHNAFYDSLTGLPNRTLLMENLKKAFYRQQRHPDWLFALLFLDLDRFKIINDSLGHSIGDQLLITLGSRLKKCLRASDTLARLGGDEFIILLEELKSKEECIKVTERIHQELEKPFILNNQELFISASIGITFSSSQQYKYPEQLLRDADTAMYKAKSLGKSCHVIFDVSMHSQALKQLSLETDLQRALKHQEFLVYYQPILSLKNNRLEGVEALVRWQHPLKGLISPVDFIPIAEESGIIIELDYWVLKSACHQLCYWRNRFPTLDYLTININISAKQFLKSNLIQKIEKILAETSLEGQNLKLEITENILIENSSYVLEIFAQLREKGVQVCLDDFGTGYSSLTYLNHFPINVLKIDRSFIKNLALKNSKSAIVMAIVAMARELKINTIAEGIETLEQLNFLKSLDCFGGQGYYFSHPLASEEMTQFINKFA